MWSFSKHHSLKSPYTINSQKLASKSKKIVPIFHKVRITENAVGVPKILVFLKYVWNIHNKAVFSNPFVTADHSTLDNFTAVWVYFRNSISMGEATNHMPRKRLVSPPAGADTREMQGMHPPTRPKEVLTWHLISLKLIDKNIVVLYIT